MFDEITNFSELFSNKILNIASAYSGAYPISLFIDKSPTVIQRLLLFWYSTKNFVIF